VSIVSVIIAILWAEVWLSLDHCVGAGCGFVGLFTLPVSTLVVALVMFLFRKRISSKFLFFSGFTSYLVAATYLILGMIGQIYSLTTSILLAIVISACLNILVLFLLLKNKYI
jgi:hypothetical protein